MIAVVMSGGSGTRLWPESRTHWPKQFSRIFSPSLQIQATRRAARVGEVWTLTTSDLRVLTEKSIKELGLVNHRGLYEPWGCNTAPAIALLCRVLELEGRDNEVVAILPADHLITHEEVFGYAVRLAEKCATQGKVVTLGVRPTSPATGYGYIHAQSKPFATDCGMSAYLINGFREKPDAETASAFVADGSYYWNGGMFVFAVKTMIAHFKEYQQVIWAEMAKLQKDLSNMHVVYQNIQPISIDYAIMEKIPNHAICCIPCDMGWSDVGSWDAVSEIDQLGLKNNVVSVQSLNNYVLGAENKIYALLGVEDLIVVDTGDAQLIAKKGESQQVREVVKQVGQRAQPLLHAHSFDERPWGSFTNLLSTENFKTKIIEVAPQQRLSYQSHSKRAEHWIIVAGQGEVILDDVVTEVVASSHVFIKQGQKHRISNTGDKPLVFVEVQLGTYFGEDDIVRYADDYSRQ